MPNEIHPEDLYFGAPAQLTYGGVAVGATIDKPKVTFELEHYTPIFQGARGEVKGTTFIHKVRPYAEFQINEITATKLAWGMPGSSSVTGDATETGGGASTTLDGGVDAGDITITVTSATGISGESTPGAHDGDFLRIGVTGETEIRRVESVSGLVVVLDIPLLRAHRDGDAVVEVDDRGTTVITWTPGRVPSESYQDLVLVGEGLDGRQLIVTLRDAMSAENTVLEFGDDSISGMPVKFKAYYDPANPTDVPATIELAPAP